MRRFVGILAVTALLAAGTSAQASMIMGALNVPVTENFDTLATSGSTPLNATTNTQQAVPGLVMAWDAGKIAGTGTTLNFIADNGTSNSGALYSYGSTGSTERALGSIASGSNTVAFGVELVNNTGSALTSVDLSFRREQWRSSTSTQNVLTFAYAVSGGSATSANYIFDAGMVAEATCNLVGDPPVAANGALDGNVNFVNVACTVTANVPNGSSLFIRWSDFNDIGNDAGLAVDDFAATARPEPATLALLGLGALAMLRRRSR